jgi:hypothetical protein
VRKEVLLKGIPRKGLPNILAILVGSDIFAGEVAVKEENDRHKDQSSSQVDAFHDIGNVVSYILVHAAFD